LITSALSIINTSSLHHKARGPDLISSRVLKETAEPIAPIVRTIFAFFLNASTVSDDQKIHT